MTRRGTLHDFTDEPPDRGRKTSVASPPATGPGETGAQVLSVGEVNRRVRNRLEGDPGLRGLHVSGEVSNLYVSGAGHVYFTLKEDGAEVRCIMWRDAAKGLMFEPKNGLAVLAYCDVTLWEQRGQFQLRVIRLEPEGDGLLWLKLAELRKKLETEGLFAEDRKRKLPKIPRRVGVVTSQEGAALQDIINVLTRRAPYLELVIMDARVQGAAAVPSLVSGLERIQQEDLDVVIIGRGGGSLEDLWAFNEELVVRAVAACRIPIVCAVGHETDWSLSDFAADERAPTPSAAAERIAPSVWELHQALDHHETRLARQLGTRLEVARHRLHAITERPVFKRPSGLVEPQRRHVQVLSDRFIRATQGRLRDTRARLEALATRGVLLRGDRLIDDRRRRLEALGARLQRPTRQRIMKAHAETRRLAGMLDALSPLKVLSRGYGVVTKDRHVIKSVDDIQAGDMVEVKITDGTIESKVTGKRRNTQ